MSGGADRQFMNAFQMCRQAVGGDEQHAGEQNAQNLHAVTLAFSKILRNRKEALFDVSVWMTGTRKAIQIQEVGLFWVKCCLFGNKKESLRVLCTMHSTKGSRGGWCLIWGIVSRMGAGFLFFCILFAMRAQALPVLEVPIYSFVDATNGVRSGFKACDWVRRSTIWDDVGGWSR